MMPRGGRGALLKLAAFALLVAGGRIFGQESERLSRELERLRPFMGEWVGEFQASEERPRILRSWSPALDGQAIREIRIVPEADFAAESLFFFEGKDGALSHLGITNNGYVTRGEILYDGEVFVQTGEQLRPDGTLGRIRVTFLFKEDGTLLNQLFNLVDGEWEPAHVVLYSRAGGEGRLSEEPER
jgi:hypothetical protein